MIVCDEIINATNSVPTNVTSIISANVANTKAKNVICTVSINSDDKKVRYKMDCYILHTVLLAIILLFKLPLFT